ncbi:MAG: VOC family protein [Propionibacteriaceae bacterium]|jgi:catechol 2,3-dioxygenase-like lactoylglutathione lyase family enzyme|nr:VOC family protein [Propionibacteriaceae bacterium]
MHLDHLTFAAGPAGLDAETKKLEGLLGEHFRDGGVHPRFGTKNRILPLADDRYLEVVEVLAHPVAEKAPFGQAVRQRSEEGGGWMSWVISVDDLAPLEARLDRKSVEGSRQFPDGRWLHWHQIGIKGLLNDPQLPYFIHWESEPDVLPSALKGDIKLVELDIAGSAERVSDWLGVDVHSEFDGVKLTFNSPNGHPGVASAIFETPNGQLKL